VCGVHSIVTYTVLYLIPSQFHEKIDYISRTLPFLSKFKPFLGSRQSGRLRKIRGIRFGIWEPARHSRTSCVWSHLLVYQNEVEVRTKNEFSRDGKNRQQSCLTGNACNNITLLDIEDKHEHLSLSLEQNRGPTNPDQKLLQGFSHFLKKCSRYVSLHTVSDRPIRSVDAKST
jgi:hypothetical protein